MNDYNRKPQYQKRLQVQLADPAINTAGPSVFGIQSISSLQLAFTKKVLVIMMIFSRIKASTEELTNVARVIGLRCYGEEAIVIFDIASYFKFYLFTGEIYEHK